MANKISEQTARLLKSVKVDLGELCSAIDSAWEKRETKVASVTEVKKSYNTRESATVSKMHLTDKEDLALRLLAFDAACIKSQKAWGVFDYSLPESLECLSNVFPFKAPVAAPVAAGIGESMDEEPVASEDNRA